MATMFMIDLASDFSQPVVFQWTFEGLIVDAADFIQMGPEWWLDIIIDEEAGEWRAEERYEDEEAELSDGERVIISTPGLGAVPDEFGACSIQGHDDVDYDWLCEDWCAFMIRTISQYCGIE